MSIVGYMNGGNSSEFKSLTERVDILEKRTRSYLWYKKKFNNNKFRLGKNE